MVKKNNMNLLGRKIDWDNPDDVREYNKVRSKKYYERTKDKRRNRNKKWREINKEKKAIKSKKYRELNKDKIRVTRQKYQETNKEKIAVTSKKYRESNKDKIKKYLEENKDKMKVKREKYYKQNKDKIKIKRKKYRETNKDKIKVSMKTYYEEHKEEDKKAICIICGKPAPIKFCSNKCKGIGQTGENGPRWQGGKSFEPYDKNWTARFKKSIRDRDNNRCMRCGRPREIFNRALDVHHIDANKLNTTKENCISLCLPCHNLTMSREEYFAKGFQNMLKRLYGYNYDKFIKDERRKKEKC